jgi:hypothetical protein
LISAPINHISWWISHDKVFSSKNPVIGFNRNVIELPGEVGSNSEKLLETPRIPKI